MAKKPEPKMQKIALYIDPEYRAALDAVETEHGTPISESVRRALKEYFEKRPQYLKKPKA